MPSGTELATTLIAKIKQHWPDPEVLAAITAPEDIDDAPEQWLTMYADNLDKLATGQKWIVGGLEIVAMKRKRDNTPPVERTPARQALIGELTAALREYILHDPAMIERALAPETIDHQSDAELTKTMSNVRALITLQRKQLLSLVDADEKAEARAANARERASAQGDRLAALQAARDKLEASKANLEAAKAKRAAERAEREAKQKAMQDEIEARRAELEPKS
jgi:hypothetical protein